MPRRRLPPPLQKSFASEIGVSPRHVRRMLAVKTASGHNSSSHVQEIVSTKVQEDKIKDRLRKDIIQALEGHGSYADLSLSVRAIARSLARVKLLNGSGVHRIVLAHWLQANCTCNETTQAKRRQLNE